MSITTLHNEKASLGLPVFNGTTDEVLALVTAVASYRLSNQSYLSLCFSRNSLAQHPFSKQFNYAFYIELSAPNDDLKNAKISEKRKDQYSAYWLSTLFI